MKRIISILLTIAIVMNIMPVMALDLSADTDYITEENVICNMMQSNAGTFSLSAVDEVDSGFDIVLGIDMSIDMLNFDYNYDKEWINTFLAIQEQAPEDTVFSTVISNTDSVASGLEEIESSLEAARYSGESDIISLLDKCVEAFDSTSDATKIIVASAATTGDASALQSKVEEVMENGIIPFVFILEEEPENAVVMDTVYYCPDNLSLRLAMSDLYLSFGELNQAAAVSAYSLQSTTTTTETGDTGVFNSDYRPRHTYNNYQNTGSALISVLNAYSVLPVRANYNDLFYDLNEFKINNADISAATLISFLKGNGKVLDNATETDDFENLWTEIYDKRNNSNNVESIIENNLKKRFPVVAVCNGSACVITALSSDGSDVYINCGDTPYNISDVTDVFDTYGYLSEMAVSSKRIKSATVQVGASINLLKVYPLNYSANDVEIADDLGILQNDEICTRVNNANLLDLTVDLAQINWSGGEVPRLVYRANVGFNENGVLDFYDPAPFYTLRLYNDVMSSKEWYYPYLMEATNLGIVNGDTDHNFKPTDPVKRCEFIKMLLEAAQIPIDTTADDGIEESWPGDWAYPYMIKANELGILKLTNDQITNIENTLVDSIFYETAITRGEVAYTIKTLLIDKRNEVQVPTLMYEYSSDVQNQRTADWNSRSTQVPDEYKDAVYQLFMNDIMVGDHEGNLLLSEPITRAEITKMVIKPLFELDEDISQVIANIEGTTNNVTNLTVDMNGIDIEDIVFDGNGKRNYTLTIPQGDTNRYYVGTYGGLLVNEEVNLTVSTQDTNTMCEEYTHDVNEHPAFSISGSGTYDISVKYQGYANVGLSVKPIGATLLKFTKNTDSSFMYVNNPEYISKYEIVDEPSIPKPAKIFEQPNVSGKNTYYQTHLSWHNTNGETGDYPVNSNNNEEEFYLDVDLYNPTQIAVSVNVTKIAYGYSSTEVPEQYLSYNDDVHTIVIEPGQHELLIKKIYDTSWHITRPVTKSLRSLLLWIDFEVVGSGNITVSSLAAYNPDNLTLKNGTMDKVIINGVEKAIDNGKVITQRDSEGDINGKYKGIARNQSAQVDVDLSFFIDNNTHEGTLKVLPMDSFYSDNILSQRNQWVTHLNPLNDYFSFWYCMPDNLHMFSYESTVHLQSGNDEPGILNYDFLHKNNSYLEENDDGYLTNQTVDTSVLNTARTEIEKPKNDVVWNPDSTALSMGSWGVPYHYTVSIENIGDDDRKVKFLTNKTSNTVFGFKMLGENDYNFNANFSAYTKGDFSIAGEDVFAGFEVDIPAGQTTVFEVIVLCGIWTSGICNGFAIIN